MTADIIDSIVSAVVKQARDPSLYTVTKNMRGRLSIVQFIQKATQDYGNAFFVDFRVDSVKPSKDGVDTSGLVGRRVSTSFFVENPAPNEKKYGYAKRDCKQFLLAALGADSSVKPEDLRETITSAISSDQPLRGLTIDFENLPKKDSPHFQLRFLNVPGQSAEAVGTNRASLDADFPVRK